MESVKAFGRAGAVLLVVVGCGSTLRLVPTGPHSEKDVPPVVVGSPPPPARVETIGADPGRACAWLDGRWEWVDQTWQWVPGGWVVPPADCYFAPPEARWVPAAGVGLLFYLPGRWYPKIGNAACEAAKACEPAAPSAPKTPKT